MSRTAQEIFQSYVYAGAMTRNADALAALFTVDGVFETPLMPAGAAFPRRLVGREEIRRTMAAYYERQGKDGRTPNLEKSGYMLHTTADPDVFIAEIDTVFDGDGDGDGDGGGGGGGGGGEGGADVTVSLVQIFRIRDGKIARLRDYFAPELMG
uniref:Nuclear transport factor 2 family protein n=1 Tax=Streptomyces sp. NBC_00003 TaxID=2903608 RepID=A0AAU2VC93_9ACTN